MSLRLLVGVVLFVALAFASAVTILSSAFLRSEIGSLLPLELAESIDAPLRTLLASQAVALFILFVFLSIAVYIVIMMLVTHPLKRLAKAMDTYATGGTRDSIPGIAEAPKEIRSLAQSFESLIERVDTSHKRDSEISRVKSDFISTAAHQLRTPLTGIRWAHEALLKEGLTESQKALVQSAVDKSKDLVAIVGTLLDISAIESGKYQYTFSAVDMHALMGEIAKDFEPAAKTAKISLFYAPAEEASLPARADRERIKWVLNNLVENAIAYTPAGGTVRLSIEASQERVFIRVKDTGIGIDTKDRGNIFERFYRAGNAIAKQNKGNGLGLYIARTIATDHGGDLSFTPNTEGPGTTFVLSLPIAQG